MEVIHRFSTEPSSPGVERTEQGHPPDALERRARVMPGVGRHIRRLEYMLWKSNLQLSSSVREMAMFRFALSWILRARVGLSKRRATTSEKLLSSSLNPLRLTRSSNVS